MQQHTAFTACTSAGKNATTSTKHLDRGAAGVRRKGFTETDYGRLLDAAHQQLGDPAKSALDLQPR
ncbi:hypothetical protein [Streptomyces sp. CdTB01]|uniref:hypothetical protein n=1 Tax=Streptomyces sp. CdTB01 TaxID=1725411 RepID=UPI00073ADE4D|nr:hypothetical protein [Streptomyces sp. CdTB01]ALV31012.1 hypothetical protein AS200_02155 [Streptomyces sp. CdTB01]